MENPRFPSERSERLSPIFDFDPSLLLEFQASEAFTMPRNAPHLWEESDDGE